MKAMHCRNKYYIDCEDGDEWIRFIARVVLLASLVSSRLSLTAKNYYTHAKSILALVECIHNLPEEYLPNKYILFYTWQ